MIMYKQDWSMKSRGKISKTKIYLSIMIKIRILPYNPCISPEQNLCKRINLFVNNSS